MIVSVCKTFEHDAGTSRIVDHIEAHTTVVDVNDEHAFNTLKADLEKCTEPQLNEENHQYKHTRTVLEFEHASYEHIAEFEYEVYKHNRPNTRVHAYFIRHYETTP